jgi:hypothetical protein
VTTLPADDNFVADAAAEELRERLKQLAKQVVDMQVGESAGQGYRNVQYLIKTAAHRNERSN